ncbi:MAG: YceI family protein [Terriglobia bacterium]
MNTLKNLRPLQLLFICTLAMAAFPATGKAQGNSPVPVFEITPQTSSVKFFVKASVAIVGSFDKWESTLKFTSTTAESGQLTIKIQADSVDTGSGMKDGKLKSKDFFNVEQDPYITFVSKKVVQTGPNTIDLQGDFTIRGVTKQETLSLTLEGKGTGKGTIKERWPSTARTTG